MVKNEPRNQTSNKFIKNHLQIFLPSGCDWGYSKSCIYRKFCKGMWNMKSNYFEFNWYFKREHKNVYPSIDNNGILPSKSYYLLEFPPDSDIWQVSYTRARRSFSIIKYQTTIKNYVKRRYLALETIIITKLFCRFIILKLIQQIEIDLFYNNQS